MPAAFYPSVCMFVNHNNKINMHKYMNILNLCALLFTVKIKDYILHTYEHSQMQHNNIITSVCI